MLLHEIQLRIKACVYSYKVVSMLSPHGSMHLSSTHIKQRQVIYENNTYATNSTCEIFTMFVFRLIFDVFFSLHLMLT